MMDDEGTARVKANLGRATCVTNPGVQSCDRSINGYYNHFGLSRDDQRSLVQPA